MKWYYLLWLFCLPFVLFGIYRSCKEDKIEERNSLQKEIKTEKLITINKTNTLDSLIYEYEQSHKGESIIDSLVDKYKDPGKDDGSENEPLEY